MLILTRRVGEAVMIGEEVTVTVLGVKGNQVRIGVNAPKTRFRAPRRDLRPHQERAAGRRPRSALTLAGHRQPSADPPSFTPLQPISIIPRLPSRQARDFHFALPGRRVGRVVEGAPLLRV